MARLDGFDTPIFDRTMTPSDQDRNTVRGLIAFLEDRRALYENPDREVTDRLIGSIAQIRQRLSDTLATGELPETISELLKPIRAACRDFLSAAEIGDAEAKALIIPSGPNEVRVLKPKAYFKLKSLRDTAGHNIGLLAVRYGINVEDQVADLIPASYA
ncbi:DUF6650 family protein [Actinoplanes derwentensis]|uniref:DUF6650 family protein n=1 Tax=Actinoplanes derwentensis TaxID=113562 RepID=UPI0019434067|nr:DUF6650 family protein [Actinoplanes derwentensis]